jgi:hypothetical protein
MLSGNEAGVLLRWGASLTDGIPALRSTENDQSSHEEAAVTPLATDLSSDVAKIVTSEEIYDP